MDGVLPIVFLGVILKIPVAALLYLVWWAFRAETLPEEAPPEPEDHRFRRFRRFRRNPLKPRGPRLRGPHGGVAQAQPDCPPAGRRRTPVVEPRLAPSMAAHEQRERTTVGT